MHLRKHGWLLLLAALAPLNAGKALVAERYYDGVMFTPPEPQIFAPGLVSGPANDGSPTFSPDGNTMFFSRSTQNWTMILESHKVNGVWSKPTIASFSGEWSDSSPEVSRDGSYIIFQSSRPITSPDSAGASKEQKPVSNLWRVNRMGPGWGKPVRLPDTVNIPGQSLWKPSIAADGTLYFTAIDEKHNKRLYTSQLKNGAYQQAQPLPFSDGTKLDVDPEIASDGSFLVFVSAGRLPGDSKDHLFIVRRTIDGWGDIVPMRYAGDEKDGYSTDDEPHLSPDQRTVYFSSDRAKPLHLPLTREQAQKDFDRLEKAGWFSDYVNIWSIPLAPWLSQ